MIFLVFRVKLCSWQLQFIFSKQNSMSHWFPTEKEGQLNQIKKRHMHSILVYNMQAIQQKKKRQQAAHGQFEMSAYRSNRDMLNDLIEENSRKNRRRYQQKKLLQESYDQQIREREWKQKELKNQENIYSHLQREYLEYQQSKRIQQLSRMFNRPTYQAIPLTHKRSKTQPEHQQKLERLYNPETPSRQQQNMGRIVSFKPTEDSRQTEPLKSVHTPKRYDNNYLPQLNVQSYHQPRYMSLNNPTSK